MSYDENQHLPTGPRRSRRGLVAVAALVPVGLAGWLIWQGAGGDGAPGPAAASTPSSAGKPGDTGPTASASPSASPSGSPSASATRSAAPEGPGGKGPLTGKVVVVDPGHNPGNFRHPSEINKLVDIGTNRKECDTTGTATADGYREADFTLDVSRRLRTLLEKQGARVEFTHESDRPFGPCIDERARFGNEAKADAVISVHADGSATGNRGFHVILPALVKGGAADTSKIVGPSRDLGERIAGHFLRATGSAPSNYVGGGTGLDERKDLGGLNLSTVPKVFIECGNMRDPKDAALLTSPGWRQKAAQGMADGIGSYLGK
ncbi:N-acetylmuramoyl-L-alanine amidase [Streptomyces sp. PKU-EA00015]|uniref:N-acetylmuramoyl-L-alanine amidase n=1 Tax=Streptomyces sp. PKU-EA00015 TaxID=2748326 RepID=UPI00159FAD37|nr:N-acetylmuramoyl-L-alanine amidase [Streptomyces sp. PKU-EA00015]NWF27576.1 N-acetylmuramoyl-L-alanine amidase [Streptomyces sp. PKU-EA00015]